MVALSFPSALASLTDTPTKEFHLLVSVLSGIIMRKRPFNSLVVVCNHFLFNLQYLSSLFGPVELVIRVLILLSNVQRLVDNQNL
jgi:hypothetical protein